MTELRLCTIGIRGEVVVHSKPTATDALEFAEKQLKNSDEFICCLSDERLKQMDNVKKLITQK